MKVLELFASTRSIGRAFERRGHDVFSVEWDRKHPDIDLYCDIGKLEAGEILEKFGRPDVCWLSPDCFAGGTLVYTKNGYQNIEDVKCFDEVLTHKGNFKQVYRTVKKNYYHNRKIKISGSEEIICTPNHPFYARKKKSITCWEKGKCVRKSWLESPQWIEAKNLTTEYKVGIPINKEQEIPIWEGYVRKYINCRGVCRTEITNTLGDKLDRDEFWWLVGRYFGDGNLSISKSTIEICCAKGEESEILPFANAFGIKYRLREKATTKAFVYCSAELVSFLSQFGIGALNKEITPTIINLPIRLLQSFLYGYLSADGHLEKRKYEVWHISSISRKLIYGLQQCILKAFGRYGAISVSRVSDEIMGRKVNVHLAYGLSWYKNETTRGFQYKIENGYAWVNVRKNEEHNGQMSLYCLSVKDDESFTVYNVGVHNCSSYSVMAISHHRNGIEPKTEYAKFCDAVNSHCMDLLRELKPRYYFIENPAGMLQHMPFLTRYLAETNGRKHLLTYCKYEGPWRDEDGNFHLPRQKRTHIFTNHPNPDFIPACKNGDKCHEAAPRGSKTGVQGQKNSVERSRIPDRLCDHIVSICENPPAIKPEDIDLFNYNSNNKE